MTLAMPVSPVVAQFFEKLKNASSAALLLDYDGTISPFHVDRFQARPYPGVLSLLDKIAESGKTRVSVISGRQLPELKALLEPFENVEMWGLHGMERLLPNGQYSEMPIGHESIELLADAKRRIVQAGLIGLGEMKRGGIAMHWRALPVREAEHAAATIRDVFEPFRRSPLLRSISFEEGVELRVAHPDKGDAVSTILRELEPRAQVAYLGDDLTDEDAFRALSGRGLTVLMRPEYRNTEAQVWLKPPADLLGFLEDWLQYSR
ncbi:MAG: trehalose-phosphatase [Terracidiphilus sp.]